MCPGTCIITYWKPKTIAQQKGGERVGEDGMGQGAECSVKNFVSEFLVKTKLVKIFKYFY